MANGITRRQMLTLGALSAVLGFGLGRVTKSTQPSTPVQPIHKLPTEKLERRIEGGPNFRFGHKRITTVPIEHEHIWEAYKEVINAVASDVNSALNAYVKQQGLPNVAAISSQQYFRIIDDVIQGSRLDSSTKDLLMKLTIYQKEMLARYLFDSLNISNFSKTPGPLRPVDDRPIPCFYDAEMLFPIRPDFRPGNISIADTVTYTTKGGRRAVFLKHPTSYNEGAWLPLAYLSPTKS